jgi:hypothetical protein
LLRLWKLKEKKSETQKLYHEFNQSLLSPYLFSLAF